MGLSHSIPVPQESARRNAQPTRATKITLSILALCLRPKTHNSAHDRERRHDGKNDRQIPDRGEDIHRCAAIRIVGSVSHLDALTELHFRDNPALRIRNLLSCLGGELNLGMVSASIEFNDEARYHN
ncbi:hypothetical protein [Burkholderia vietnamiensis]|uniref:hypothetical protein n=1 Tax=Burkholderia vietnamiensis TaxID=60552 RepID=UPI0013E00E65|nr:hypothetical protein [Burkholderia vietnamiensis]